MTVTPIRTLIVDDHKIVVDGLIKLLEREPDISVIATASSLAEAAILAQRVQPDVIILDLKLPDARGTGSVHAVRQHFPNSKILVLTGFGDKMKAECKKAGADLFFTKELASEQLIPAILSLSSHPSLQGSRHEALTGREIEVARLASQGHSNEEISASLNVSVNTVKTHMSSILRKLELRDRVGLAAYWNEQKR